MLGAEEVGALQPAFQVIGAGPVDLVMAPGFVSNVEMWWAEPKFVHLFERFRRFHETERPEVLTRPKE